VGTDVFAVDNGDGASDSPAFISGFPVDMSMTKQTNGGSGGLSSRLTQGKRLETDTTGAEGTSSFHYYDFMDGCLSLALSSSYYTWMWKRAKGFFDVVAYTGNAVAGREVAHSLGVVPEMMWVKKRSGTDSWMVYNKTIGNTDTFALNSANTFNGDNTVFWNDTTPSDTTFTLGSYDNMNGSGFTFIAYLFASLAGISKVGSYTGNGSNQTIDCGFSAGARFILIKRTDANGDWFMWDTARGIVAGNDPHLSLNTTAAEVTSDDSVDPANSGFIVNQVAATNINVSSGTYIFYAIA
jgi:hypothetical protein